jgi:alkylation response protein AidB-like acyl-CoA dehydrogenase
MRSIGVCQRAIDMMCERAESRFTQGSPLADKQFVQGYIADSYTELLQFRMAVLYCAWLIDTGGERAARKDIAALKVALPKVVQTILLRAIQVHGALGTTDQMPLFGMFLGGVVLGLADGPTEAHKVNLARQVLKDYAPDDPMWPTEFRGRREEAAREKYGHLVESVPSIPSVPSVPSVPSPL